MYSFCIVLLYRNCEKYFILGCFSQGLYSAAVQKLYIFQYMIIKAVNSLLMAGLTLESDIGSGNTRSVILFP